MACSKPIIRSLNIHSVVIPKQLFVHLKRSISSVKSFDNLSHLKFLKSKNLFSNNNQKTVRLSQIYTSLIVNPFGSKRYYSWKPDNGDSKEGKESESSKASTSNLFSTIESGTKMMMLLALLVVLLISGTRFLTVIPAGHMGLLDVFGKVDDRTISSGLNIKNPLAKVIKVSLQTQIESVMTEVPSKEGLLVKLEVALQYHIDPKQARDLYINVGTNYEDVLLRPQFLSTIRQVTSSYDAKALYTSESRSKMSQEIKEHLNHSLSVRGIVIEDAPMKKIILPDKLASSIELKLSAEQESQRMEFTLQKERLEAERKSIEAKGISAFQKIVAEGVSDQLLKWKGIEATERLAESHNAKIIIIGGKDGLPIILNTDKK